MTEIARQRRINELTAEGLDGVQAYHVLLAEIANKNALGRNPRAWDYRFGREF